MSKVETYGARTIGADCMDVIGAASILIEVYAQIFRIVVSIRIYQETCVGILFLLLLLS